MTLRAQLRRYSAVRSPEPPLRRLGAGVVLAAEAALALAAGLVLLACGGRAIGYGLLLWADSDTAFVTGEVLKVIQESSIQGDYLVRPEGSKQLVEIPTWRMRLFETKDQARAAAQAYSSYVEEYGYSERDGLPLREQPDPEARRVYKLRAGQLVKIVLRGEQQEQVAGYQDFWYEVLTEDGARGYCFGAYLPVFTSAGNPAEESERLRSRDPMLELLVSTPWRPEYFQEMADNGRVDLNRFTPEVGLFVDPEARSVELVTHRGRQSFEYSTIENVGPNRYEFVRSANRPELRAHLQSPDRLVLSFTQNDQVVSSVFVAFQGDVEAIIAAEGERRKKLYDGFVARGRILTSTGYGSIALQEGMRFLWQDFGRLQDLVFLKKVQGSGSVDFPYRLSSQLAGRYDGVISFRFREYGTEEDSSFLYRFDSVGVRFESIRPGNVEDLEVVRPDVSALVVYFTFGGS